MARGGNGTREMLALATSNRCSEELPDGHVADDVLHEVPLALQHHLVHPRNSKTIPKVLQARLYCCGAQLCLRRKRGLAIDRDKGIDLAADAVARVAGRFRLTWEEDGL